MSEPAFACLEVVRLRPVLGTIVEQHIGGDFYEVEFADEDGNTIAHVALPACLLEATGETDP